VNDAGGGAFFKRRAMRRELAKEAASRPRKDLTK